MAVGDITYSNLNAMSGEGAFASGTLIVDANAAATIICGFQPSRIELILADAGGSADSYDIWFLGMTAGTTMHMDNAGAITFPTTLGPTVYAGTVAGNSEGFTIPADQTGAADSDVIYWCAWR